MTLLYPSTTLFVLTLYPYGIDLEPTTVFRAQELQSFEPTLYPRKVLSIPLERVAPALTPNAVFCAAVVIAENVPYPTAVL